MKLLDVISRRLCAQLITSQRIKHEQVIRDLKERINRLQQLHIADTDRLRVLAEKNHSLKDKVRQLYRRNVDYAARLNNKHSGS